MKATAEAYCAVRKRQSGIFTRGDCGCDARDNFKVDLRGGQSRRLFASATEDIRIAPLQTNDDFAGPCLGNQPAIDGFLPGDPIACLLSMRAIDLPRRESQEQRIDQAVVQDEIGRPQTFEALDRQEPRIARASSDEIHLTLAWHRVGHRRAAVGKLAPSQEMRCPATATLGPAKFVTTARRVQHLDVVGFRTDGGWAVRDDPVAVFRPQFLQGVLPCIGRLERKAQHPATVFEPAQFGQHVVCLDHFEGNGTAGLGDFARNAVERFVVADGGGGDDSVTIGEPGDAGVRASGPSC